MAFSWPVAVTILGFAFLGMFRDQIKSLLDRTEKIKDWVTAPKAPTQVAGTNQSLISPLDAGDQSTIEELTAGFENPVLVGQEKRIREDLKQYGLSAESKTEKILLRHLASTQITLHFERVDSSIFGSQIRLLRWLNGQPVATDENAAQVFYDSAKHIFPNTYQTYAFQEYLSFLSSFDLITHLDKKIEITSLGREFLKHLIELGKSEDRHG